MNKEITPAVGIGEIKFGMLKSDIITLLGEPTLCEIEKDFETGDAVETCEYEDLGIAFSFDEEEGWRLETITLNSSRYTLDSVGLVGKNIQQVQDFIEEHELGEMEIEDFSTPELPNYELIDIDEANMFFWFNGGVCTEIQMGVHWDEDDNAKWPE